MITCSGAASQYQAGRIRVSLRVRVQVRVRLRVRVKIRVRLRVRLGEVGQEVGQEAAVLGFIGAPWTLATYVVEGASSSTYKTIKKMMYTDADVLDKLLSHIAVNIGDYMSFQIEAGAQCVMIFDSWGGQLPPHLWDKWSKPYIQMAVDLSLIHISEPTRR